MSKSAKAKASERVVEGRRIVLLDVHELVKLLNKAFADEWSAYYQYWISAKIIRGPDRTAVAAELMEHAGEELKHANMLADRIVQLGGVPLVSPELWFKERECVYNVNADSYVKAVLTENIKGEQCAIRVYNTLLKKVEDKDPVTYDILLRILIDEVTHEHDLMRFLDDMHDCCKE